MQVGSRLDLPAQACPSPLPVFQWDLDLDLTHRPSNSRGSEARREPEEGMHTKVLRMRLGRGSVSFLPPASPKLRLAGPPLMNRGSPVWLLWSTRKLAECPLLRVSRVSALEHAETGGVPASTQDQAAPHAAAEFWTQCKQLLDEGVTVTVTLTGANRGGLLVRYGDTAGFIPNSHCDPVGMLLQVPAADCAPDADTLCLTVPLPGKHRCHDWPAAPRQVP